MVSRDLRDRICRSFPHQIGEHTKQGYELGKWKWKRDVSNSDSFSESEAFSTSIWSTKVDWYCPYDEIIFRFTESREGRNSDHILPGAFSVKYDMQVGPALWASCAENQPCFSFLSISSPSSVLQLGRNGVLPGNHGFLGFRHWLLVEPLEWNEIIISGDIFSMSQVLLYRRLILNGVSVWFFPLSSGNTYSSFSFEIVVGFFTPSGSLERWLRQQGSHNPNMGWPPIIGTKWKGRSRMAQRGAWYGVCIKVDSI